MTPLNMPIVESTQPSQFCTRVLLEEHVRKHLLEGRDERWHHVLDLELLSAARTEWHESSGEFGTFCWKLATAYEKILSDAIVEACARQNWHMHWAIYRTDIEHDQSITDTALSQEIDAWPVEHKL